MQYTDMNDDINKTSEETKNSIAIGNALRHIFSTRPGTVPGHPLFGCNLDRFLFELITPLTIQFIKNEIIYAVNLWEPRIELIEVNVIDDTDYNKIKIIAKYKIKREVNPKDYEFVYQINK